MSFVLVWRVTMEAALYHLGNPQLSPRSLFQLITFSLALSTFPCDKVINDSYILILRLILIYIFGIIRKMRKIPPTGHSNSSLKINGKNMAKQKKTNNSTQNASQKTKDRGTRTRTQQKTLSDSRFSSRVSRSCFTCDICKLCCS